MQLTIIIPTCNRSVESLSRAIDSAINQHLSDFEIIIIDDSPRLNNKLKSLIVNKYSSYNLYYYINDGMHGVANARNLGVELAKGQYVTFLDDDDMYLPGRLVNMLSEMENKTSIFVSSSRFYEMGDFSEIHNVPYQYTGKITLEDIKYANDIDIGFMVSRSDFLRLGGFDSSFTNLEDWDFVIRMLKEGNGYKLGRLDYAVNIDPNRDRVSTNDSKGYRELAQKYHQEFGSKWYSIMLSMADRLEGKLTLIKAISYTFRSGVKLPFIIYLKYKFQFLKKYFIK
jgi:glycosyltransferase involved in cell wall biosynthesis